MLAREDEGVVTALVDEYCFLKQRLPQGSIAANLLEVTRADSRGCKKRARIPFDSNTPLLSH